MPVDFLESETPRPWASDRVSADCDLYLGEGSNGLEVLVTERDDRPQKSWLQRLYTDRRNQRINPILVVVLRDDGQTVDIIGPAGEDPDVKRDLEPSQVERICASALDRPDHHAAQRFLSDVFAQIDEELVGLRNQGLLSTHELKSGVPERDDWENAVGQAEGLLDEEGRDLVEGLGYEIERLQDHSYILKDTSDGREQVVAIFLNEDESFDHAQDRFTGQTPVSYALSEADKKNLDYVIASSESRLRLYTTNPDAGFGSRGRTDTFVEVNTDLLTDDKAGYLPLLFSSSALQDEGSLHEIIADSKDYATSLGDRLRKRIYNDVVPDLAEAIADARDLDDPTKEELDETYQMALVQLYRLLFVAYAEDEGFLPRHNPRYEKRSLKSKAHELHDLVEDGVDFDDNSTTHWDDVMELIEAIHDGHAEWGLPEYDGSLLSSDSSVSEAGGELAEIELTDDQFGPVLANLLIDEIPGGESRGPVDFRNIGVREFGVIYEGLLESELSLAEDSLGIDDDGHYLPVDPEEEDVVVQEGEVYLHGQSGERKSTGTYYTKTEFVEHLLDYSLEPALEEHIERLEEMSDHEAAENFFDIRVADVAMGSGHFLVSAVDRIENRLYSYLAERTLPEVEDELDRLEEAAQDAFESEQAAPDIERGQLLRRQVARRCVYGVDLNSEAAELARLSLWVHTFVPGLPLTFLDYNLRSGDSLVGIGRLSEANQILGREDGQSLLNSFISDEQGTLEEIQNEVKKIGQFADLSAEQVQEARQTRDEIESELQGAKAACDILSASRVNDDINVNVVSDLSINNLTQLSSYEAAQETLGPMDPVHFPVTFPEVFAGDEGGFDVIVGNPPWDKVLFEEQQFWVTRHPGLNSLPKTKRDDRIEELREQYPQEAKVEEREQQQREQYQDYVGEAYDKQGRGHYDYSKLFVERALSLMSNSGELGYVLPRQSLVLSGWKQLRRALLDDSELTVLQARNSGGWIFEDIHKSYMVILLTRSPTSDGSGAYIWPAVKNLESLQKVTLSDALYLSYEDLADLTTENRLVMPWFDSQDAKTVYPKMQTRPRIADNEGWFTGEHDTRWDFRGSGRHSDLVKDDYEADYWKIFMTRNVDQYGINEDKDFRRYVDPDDLLNTSNDVTERNGDIVLGEDHPAIAFRHVSRSTDTRTLIGTMLPESGYLFNSGYIHAIAHSSDTTDRELHAMLAYLNSFTGDWWARRIVDRHVTAPVISNLPIPDWDTDQIEEAGKLGEELTARNDIDTLPGGRTVSRGTV